MKCEQCPVRFYLGEQAEVLIQVATLKQARLVPEAAVSGFDGARVRCGPSRTGAWGAASCHSAIELKTHGWRSRTAFRSGALVVTEISAALQEGRCGKSCARGQAMNLAYRDVRHNLFRFLLTCFGLESAAQRRAGYDRHLSRHRCRRPDGGAQSPCRSVGRRSRIARTFRRGLAHTGRQPRRDCPTCRA